MTSHGSAPRRDDGRDAAASTARDAEAATSGDGDAPDASDVVDRPAAAAPA